MSGIKIVTSDRYLLTWTGFDSVYFARDIHNGGNAVVDAAGNTMFRTRDEDAAGWVDEMNAWDKAQHKI